MKHLSIAKKTNFSPFGCPEGTSSIRTWSASLTSHHLCMITGSCCVSQTWGQRNTRSWARLSQHQIPGTRGQCRDSFSSGESQRGQVGRKEPFSNFSCLYSWVLFQKHQCSALDKIFHIFFSCLATGRLSLAADLSAQEKDRKYRADHSWRVKPKIKIKYIQCHKIKYIHCQLPTLGLSKQKTPLNRGIKNICFTDPRGPLACLHIAAQEIRSGLGLLISYLLLSFKNMTNLMLKTPSQQETWVNTRGKTGKRTNQKHRPPHLLVFLKIC